MMFFSILLCLILERLFFLEPFLQRAAGFNYYLTWVGQTIPLKWQKQHYGLLLLLLPALTVTLVLYLISICYFSDFSSFLLETVILFYCLGPDTVYHTPIEIPEELFEKAYMGLFGTLFWFALLGSFGALLFRLMERIASIKSESPLFAIVPEEIRIVSKPLLGYLSWLPIRFFIAIQAVLGKFPETLRYWLDHLLTGWIDHSQFVAGSGRIALNLSEDILLDPEGYKKALNLFDKTLLIFLGMILIYTLLFWII